MVNGVGGWGKARDDTMQHVANVLWAFATLGEWVPG